MNLPERHPASYRDPEARVWLEGARVLRGFSEKGARRHEAVVATGLIAELERDGMIVATREGPGPREGFARVVEHDAIPLVSYPYEWPFDLLRRAALLHLDVQLRALERGVALADASAYNVQFRAVQPVLIDVGSFRPYCPGELWLGHRQFCEQFLNPLLLAADVGVAYQRWYRGAPEGIPTTELARLLPWRRRFSPRHLFHVLLPARAERHAQRREAESVRRINAASLPVEGYRLMLSQLRKWIASLRLARRGETTWERYTETRTYAALEVEAKHAAVREFAEWSRPAHLVDIGCNDGEFAEAALLAGAQRATGLDADLGALDAACRRAERRKLDLLPLFQDAADPSPGHGWRGIERAPLFERLHADAVMALAVVHHLALGRNLPLAEVVELLTGIAPRGLVEFVPKSDPTAQRMLALKGDIFPGYEQGAFEQALGRRARIVRSLSVSATGRRLYWFER